MDNILVEQTKKAAYIMWTVTEEEDTMSLWYCAEDIACFFIKSSILEHDTVYNILNKDKKDPSYIFFIRNIAYRLYIYTNRADELMNWNNAETLAYDQEWVDMVVCMSVRINEIVNTGNGCSAWAKKYFSEFK